MKTLLLIDGNAIMHRAFHALPPMNSNDGIPTNMTYGFFTIISKVISDIKPEYLIVCFDTPKPTFRQELLEEYQAQRPHAPDEFKIQIPYIRSLLDAAGIARLEKDGFEADDVIGSLATRFKNEAKIYILTGDKDIMQLVNDSISVITPQIGFSKGNLFTPAEVHNKLGVFPQQIPDYKALAGDPSDNYKGVKGVGPKTASDLIRKFGSVESLLENLKSVENEKLRSNLENHRDIITLTKKIATIVKDIDFTKSLEEYRFSAYKPDMKPKLMELQLYSLVKKFFPQASTAKTKKEKPTEEKEPQMGLF